MIYRPDNAVLFVVGRMEPEAVKSLVEQHFGDWDVRESRLELVEALRKSLSQWSEALWFSTKSACRRRTWTLGCQVLPRKEHENAQTHTVGLIA